MMFVGAAFVCLIGLATLYVLKREQDQPLEKHEVRQGRFWDEGGNSQRRIGPNVVVPAAKSLLEYLARVNADDQIQGIPSKQNVTPDDLIRVQRVIGNLPAAVSELFSSKTVRISVVSGLGTSAFSTSIFDSNGAVVGGFVVLDASVLRKTPNDWFTARERSPFDCTTDTGIDASISDGRNEDDGVRYILFHELAHVYAYTGNLHPQWFEAPSSERLRETTYAPLSWAVVDGKYRGTFSQTPMLETGVRYYADSADRAPCARVGPLYEELQRTNFPALYATKDPSEDFAESFANFVHSELLKRPFAIKQRGSSRLLYGSCWKQRRCTDKYEFFSKIFGRGAY
jgi:hypothetical protein